MLFEAFMCAVEMAMSWRRLVRLQTSQPFFLWFRLLVLPMAIALMIMSIPREIQSYLNRNKPIELPKISPPCQYCGGNGLCHMNCAKPPPPLAERIYEKASAYGFFAVVGAIVTAEWAVFWSAIYLLVRAFS